MAFKQVIIRRVGPLFWLLGGVQQKANEGWLFADFSAFLRLAS